MKTLTKTFFSAALIWGTTACTGQIAGSFTYAQQKETFNLTQDINTKIDMLWVVDNSASMDTSQQKLRNAFAAFASTYMQPTWDIRVAVITTDTYLANPAYHGYLTTTISGSGNYHSNYAAGRGSWPNPSWDSDLYNAGSTNFRAAGLKFWELVPGWNAYANADSTITWARLLPGLHDGPTAGLCTEIFPTKHFYNGVPNCSVRDAVGANSGAEHCLRPTGGESSLTQCVNTIQNDTVRSGQAIIETLGQNAVTLQDNFKINATTGTAGSGSERGMQSVTELLSQNETKNTALFRANSTRMIVFISDEDDQTMTVPTAGEQATHNVWDYYRCDAAGFTTLNPTTNITGNGGVCCSNGTCTYGVRGTSCYTKTYAGEGTRTITICPDNAKLVPVSSIKSTLDSFFQNLDHSGSSGNPNYVVAAIVPLTLASVNSLQSARTTEDASVGVVSQYSVDRGDRYMELADLVGNGSLKMELNTNDFSPLLDSIGHALIDNKSHFTLTREPTSNENMIVKIIHSGGSSTTLASSKYSVSAKVLTITDITTVLGFQQGDQLYVDYQPKNLN